MEYYSTQKLSYKTEFSFESSYLINKILQSFIWIVFFHIFIGRKAAGNISRLNILLGK